MRAVDLFPSALITPGSCPRSFELAHSISLLPTLRHSLYSAGYGTRLHNWSKYRSAACTPFALFPLSSPPLYSRSSPHRPGSHFPVLSGLSLDTADVTTLVPPHKFLTRHARLYASSARHGRAALHTVRPVRRYMHIPPRRATRFFSPQLVSYGHHQYYSSRTSVAPSSTWNYHAYNTRLVLN